LLTINCSQKCVTNGIAQQIVWKRAIAHALQSLLNPEMYLRKHDAYAGSLREILPGIRRPIPAP